MNRKLQILGTMHLILGGGGMLACMAAYLCWIKLASDAHSLRTAHTLGQMMFMLSMFILLPSFVCGIGLVLNKSWGRVAAIGWSMLLLLVIPIGTLLGGYGLWVLLKRTPLSANHAGSQPSSRPYHPHDFEPRPTSSLIDEQHLLSGRAGLLLVMLVVGASMVVLLRAGFWFAGQRPPAEINDPFRIAALLLLGFVVAFIVVAVRDPRKRPTTTQNIHAASDQQPAAHKSSPLVNQDAICLHLQPIESVMRGCGINIAQQAGRDARANCQVDLVELGLVFSPTIETLYVERHDIDRSYHDPKTALFWCAACNSSLWVVHADAATEKTPWFPENASYARSNAVISTS